MVLENIKHRIKKKTEEEFCKRQLANYGYLSITQSAKEVYGSPEPVT
jgi:hypothetical protein